MALDTTGGAQALSPDAANSRGSHAPLFELANYTRYAAVHWFSYYQLAAYLLFIRRVQCFDRFDVMLERWARKSAPQASRRRMHQHAEETG